MRNNIPFSITILVSFLFARCGSDGEIKTFKDSSTGVTHGISVSGQNAVKPHAVNDTAKNGEHIERYDNGVISVRGEMKNGFREGEWLTFYRDGKLWSKGTYKDGFREGYGIALFPNGEKSQEGYYKHDRMIGKWSFWDEYGNKKEKDFGGQ